MLTGLRVDVDTLRGTKLGVPRLLETFARFGIRASFFFSVGPDNMGRNLWRLFKPAFLWKMLRTNAPSLYGWDILRCGVIGQGPLIGRECAAVIRRAAAEGHEAGLHAWDHHRWQTADLDETAAAAEIDRGFACLAEILGVPPSCSAAPAWRATPATFAAKMRHPFAYNSDCRGSDCFLPTAEGKTFQPQVPVTLPTYDEMRGVNGVDDGNYNERLLELFRPEGLNVLCIHAEVEGVAKAAMFEEFLRSARERGVCFDRLDAVLAARQPLRTATVEKRSLPGREGWLCFQQDERQ